MPEIHQEPAPVSPLVITGLILAAFEHLDRLELAHPTAIQVLEATGAGRAQAYEYRRRVLELVAELARPVGRPCTPTPTPALDTGTITRELLAFVMSHPGSISAHTKRNHYGDALRAFVLELREQYATIDLARFAEATHIPRGTLEDWITRAAKPKPPSGASSSKPPPVATATELEREVDLRSQSTSPRDGETENVDAKSNANTRSSKSESTIPEIETILREWDGWRGGFGEFCRHLQVNLRLTHGRSWIASVLEAHGRKPRRRGPRTIDQEAIRGAFERFFPGAQWVGDGMQVTLRINDRSFRFNLELIVDVDSGAFVGLSVRSQEDAAAVVSAFDDAKHTTGAAPLALLLDNRPSNHDATVDAALGDTMRIRATTFRPENKAHVEGAFGLFSQTAPVLEISAATPDDIARGFIELVVTIWARATNHLPRADRKGRSRVDLYREADPTPEQIAAAREKLRERMRQQELARQRQHARQDPTARRILDTAFVRLGLLDPEEHFRTAIASFPLDAIIAGIAIFEGKKKAATLPDGVDARYLLGIVKHVSQDNEGIAIAEALLRARIDAHDRALALLEARRIELSLAPKPFAAMLEQLTCAVGTIDRLFWRGALADLIAREPIDQRDDLLRRAAQRIQAAYRISYRDRQIIVRRLFEQVVPVI